MKQIPTAMMLSNFLFPRATKRQIILITILAEKYSLPNLLPIYKYVFAEKESELFDAS